MILVILTVERKVTVVDKLVRQQVFVYTSYEMGLKQVFLSASVHPDYYSYHAKDPGSDL